MKKDNSRNTKQLREILFNTLDDVVSGDISVAKAGSISKISSQIISSARLEIDYARLLQGEEGPIEIPNIRLADGA